LDFNIGVHLNLLNRTKSVWLGEDMDCDYPVLRIRQIGTRFEFELLDPLLMQIAGIERKQASFTSATKHILASYGSLVALAGSTREKMQNCSAMN
jgi:hypothetical protein